jgi:hypothetical protein
MGTGFENLSLPEIKSIENVLVICWKTILN